MTTITASCPTTVSLGFSCSILVPTTLDPARVITASTSFGTKDPSSTEIFSFNFGPRWLATGETVLSAVISITSKGNTDPDPDIMITSFNYVYSNTVSTFVTGGLSGSTYILECKAITSLGQTLIMDGYIPVNPLLS